MCACDCKEPEDDEPTQAESDTFQYNYCQSVPIQTAPLTTSNYPSPCPSCGHCPTCGRGRSWSGPYWNVYPYWQQLYAYPQTYWYTTATGAGNGAVSYNF